MQMVINSTTTTAEGDISTTSDILNFTYDATGLPLTLTYDNATYYYVTNVQGDVVAILDSNGQSMVTYSYSAWGACRSISGELASDLGEINPLRYRSYTFDAETKFYYLQSRYYNPSLGRFVNSDSLASTGQGFLGHNMFSYCNNNPIIREDESGAFWGVIIGGGIAGALVSTISYISSNKDNITRDGIALAVSSGFLCGMTGAIAGVESGLILACSVAVAAITFAVTAVNTEGSKTTKLVSGGVSALVAGLGTYAGAKAFPIRFDNEWIEGFTAFTGGYLAGMLTDGISVAAQNIAKPIAEAVESLLPPPEKKAAQPHNSCVGGAGRNTFHCLM